MLYDLIKKSFFDITIGITPNCYWKPNIESISPKKMKKTTRVKTHLKSDCIDGSILKRVQEGFFSRFFPDKTSGFKIFFEPETKQF